MVSLFSPKWDQILTWQRKWILLAEEGVIFSEADPSFVWAADSILLRDVHYKVLILFGGKI